MIKKTFCAFFVCLLIFLTAFSVSAYTPTGFDLNAKNVLLASLDTDEILFEKGSEEKVFPASITKIMTAMVILESPYYNPNSIIEFSDQVDAYITGTGSVVSNLKVGEQVPQIDMLYYLIVSSCGDCAYQLALSFGGTVDNFVNMMNEKAKELGLKNTHYANPVGLHDEQNYTTAQDTYILTKYALKNETFKKICSSPRYTTSQTNLSKPRVISTTNFLIDNTTNYYYQYACGVKTGTTDESGRCLVSCASYNGYNYICILFGCSMSGTRHDFKDTKNLYRWAFNTFSYKQIADTDNPVCEVGVDLSLSTDYVSLYVEKSFISCLPKEADTSTIQIKPNLKEDYTVDAPIKKGQVIGTADIIYAEKVIGTVNLISHENIESNFMLVAVRAIKNFFTSSYMKFVYALIGIAVILFIAATIYLNYKKKNKNRVKYIPMNKGKKR